TLRDMTKPLPIDSRINYRLALSSDHHWAAAASGMGELLLWSTSSGQLVRTKPGIIEPMQSISMGSNIVAIGGQRGLFKLWSAGEKKELATIASDDLPSISCISFSRKEDLLALAKGSSVQLCFLATNPPAFFMFRSLSSADEPSSLTFSSDGQRLAVGT